MNQNQQDFEKLFRSELESIELEIKDSDFQNLMSAWKVAMNCSSLQAMDCDVEIYLQISVVLNSNGDVKFNLFNASFLFNAVSKISPRDLGVSVERYVALNLLQKEISTKWNEVVSPIRTKLMNKLQTQAALQVPKNGMNVIPGKGR